MPDSFRVIPVSLSIPFLLVTYIYKNGRQYDKVTGCDVLLNTQRLQRLQLVDIITCSIIMTETTVYTRTMFMCAEMQTEMSAHVDQVWIFSDHEHMGLNLYRQKKMAHPCNARCKLIYSSRACDAKEHELKSNDRPKLMKLAPLLNVTTLQVCSTFRALLLLLLCPTETQAYLL